MLAQVQALRDAVAAAAGRAGAPGAALHAAAGAGGPGLPDAAARRAPRRRPPSSTAASTPTGGRSAASPRAPRTCRAAARGLGIGSLRAGYRSVELTVSRTDCRFSLPRSSSTCFSLTGDALVAPAVADIGGDVGDLLVGQLPGEARHGQRRRRASARRRCGCRRGSMHDAGRVALLHHELCRAAGRSAAGRRRSPGGRRCRRRNRSPRRASSPRRRPAERAALGLAGWLLR